MFDRVSILSRPKKHSAHIFKKDSMQGEEIGPYPTEIALVRALSSKGINLKNYEVEGDVHGDEKCLTFTFRRTQ